MRAKKKICYKLGCINLMTDVKIKVNIRFIGMLQNLQCILPKLQFHTVKKIVLFYCIYIYIYIYIYINNNLEIRHNNIYGRINLS